MDASAQSRSVAALVHGFASWDPGVRLAGVILNKVGSDRHEELLRAALDEAGVPVLGALRRAPQVQTPSRHLGLVPVAERQAEAVDSVRAQAAQVRRAATSRRCWRWRTARRSCRARPGTRRRPWLEAERAA